MEKKARKIIRLNSFIFTFSNKKTIFGVTNFLFLQTLVKLGSTLVW